MCVCTCVCEKQIKSQKEFHLLFLRLNTSQYLSEQMPSENVCVCFQAVSVSFKKTVKFPLSLSLSLGASVRDCLIVSSASHSVCV